MHHTLPIISFFSCFPILSGFINPHFVMFSEEREHSHGHKKGTALWITHGADKCQIGSTAKFHSYRLNRDLEASFCHCGNLF